MKSFILSALLMAGVAAPASAEDSPAITKVVQTADLDLTSAAGQRALARRIAAAVVEVCGTASDSDLHGKNRVRDCRSDARMRVLAERDKISRADGSPIVLAAR